MTLSDLVQYLMTQASCELRTTSELLVEEKANIIYFLEAQPLAVRFSKIFLKISARFFEN